MGKDSIDFMALRRTMLAAEQEGLVALKNPYRDISRMSDNDLHRAIGNRKGNVSCWTMGVMLTGTLDVSSHFYAISVIPEHSASDYSYGAPWIRGVHIHEHPGASWIPDAPDTMFMVIDFVFLLAVILLVHCGTLFLLARREAKRRAGTKDQEN